MTQLQDDILEIYNSLVIFSDTTIKSKFPTPIKVSYEKSSRFLIFEQKGISARLYLPIYYCLGLDDLETSPSYLLPEDYDYIMSTFQYLIGSGELIKPRTLVSPENYGFDVYATDPKELWKGPDRIGSIRFVSGTSWFFRLKIKLKYKLK